MSNVEPPMFKSARLKIERANHHIEDLNGLVTFSSQPYRDRVLVENDAETGEKQIGVKILGSDIEMIPMILGDAIHNLRTALDHVAQELILRSGGKPTYHTKFTIRKTRKEAIAAIDGEIKGVGLDVITGILELVQPYRGGLGDALWTLHQLDIVDKHRLIVPVLSAAKMTVQVVEEKRPFTVRVALAGGKEAHVVEEHVGLKIQDYGNPVLDIRFNDIEGLKDQSVIPTLRHFSEVTLAAVQEVERAFLTTREWYTRTGRLRVV